MRDAAAEKLQQALQPRAREQREAREEVREPSERGLARVRQPVVARQAQPVSASRVSLPGRADLLTLTRMRSEVIRVISTARGTSGSGSWLRPMRTDSAVIAGPGASASTASMAQRLLEPRPRLPSPLILILLLSREGAMGSNTGKRI